MYKALDKSGKTREGSLEAEEEKGVVRQLQALGYIPVKIYASSSAGEKEYPWSVFLQFFNKIPSREIVGFTQKLSILIDAGHPLDQSLSISMELVENPKFKTVLSEIVQEVRQGSSLANALDKFPQAFSPLYVNMVKAGEAGGVLEVVLKRLSNYLEEAQNLKEYIVSAMVYPIFLTFVAGLSVTVLLTWVIPKFAQIFSDMGASLPLPTQILLGVSGVFRNFWWVGILGGIGLYTAARNYLKTEEGRFRWDRIKLKMIFWGKVTEHIEVARFTRTMGTLLEGGVPILQALSIVKETVSNEVIKRALAEVYNGTKKGEGFYKPLVQSGAFPPLALHMIKVGEETGKTEEMLLKIAETYEGEVKVLVKKVVSLLEPIVILGMGLVVGFIVLSMLIAIFSVNQISF